jgi:hypothetical protein
MTILSLRAVNRALAKEGIRGEINRGKGYFYFTGDDLENSSIGGVYVYRLNQLTLEQWLEEAMQRKQELEKRAEW